MMRRFQKLVVSRPLAARRFTTKTTTTSSGGTQTAYGRKPDGKDDSPWSRRIGAVVFVGVVGCLGGLGTWQVIRRQWKIDLIEERTARVEGEPTSLQELEKAHPGDLEFRRASVTGTFDYTQQIFLGPRSVPNNPDPAISRHGYYLITPMKTADGRDLLVNRGWVSIEKYKQDKVCAEAEAGPVTVTGVLTKGETRNRFLKDWQPRAGKRTWIVLDSAQAYKHLKLDAGEGPALVLEGAIIGGKSDGPILRKLSTAHMEFNTTPGIHLLYAATWYSVGAAVSALTYFRFRRKPRL